MNNPSDISRRGQKPKGGVLQTDGSDVSRVPIHTYSIEQQRRRKAHKTIKASSEKQCIRPGELFYDSPGPVEFPVSLSDL